jgi:hypothetical protein
MKRSIGRILTTHAGSLPRPADLLAMGEVNGKADAAAYEARLAQAVGEIVRKQVELGIDVVDDGEYGKPGFVTYVIELSMSACRASKSTPSAPAATPGRARAKRGRFRNSMPPPRRSPARATCTWCVPARSPIADTRSSCGASPISAPRLPP